ncbi:peptidase A2 domain-containing protein [Trichonephila clavipes]|nr:peptidase A2 domain-containing protein [Trichonephila clavipes]
MAEPSKHTSRLFLLDRKSGQKFLIDSGSEICVIPPSPTMNKSPQSNFSLFAANNIKIPAYALQPLIDLKKKKRLVDVETSLFTSCVFSNIVQPSILTVDANISFKNILSEYPDLSNPLISKSASHGTVHHIITTGPPVTARPRRLHPKLYDAVKVEFEFLLAQGIIRPSKSPWSSPLHVVPKSDSTVRPVGDYRQLNSVTEFDSYPMPYLNDFAHALHGKKIFSKIDIFKAFHQSLHPKPPKHHGKRPIFIHPGLLEATHVFLRRDMLRRPLQQPYDGPFKVLQRKDKVFFLDINGKRVSVSIDRCKPAFFLNTEDLQLPQTKNETPATVEPNATASTPATVESDPTASTPTQPSTRSGRKVHLPTRYR